MVSLGIGYLIGSISVSSISARLRHNINLAEAGKGGARTWSRYYRLYGFKETWLAAVGELLKGTLSAFLAYCISGGYPAAVIIAGLGCIIGHAYPLYFGFKGGKSMSVGGGILLFMGLQEPILLLIIGVAIVIVALMWKRSDTVSHGSLSATTFIWISTLLAHELLEMIPDLYAKFIYVGCGIIYVLFRNNIIAILGGTEHKTPFPTHHQ